MDIAHHSEKGMVVGPWGGQSHCLHSQETYRVEWTEEPQDLPLLTHFSKLCFTLEPRHQAFKYTSLWDAFHIQATTSEFCLGVQIPCSCFSLSHSHYPHSGTTISFQTNELCISLLLELPTQSSQSGHHKYHPAHFPLWCLTLPWPL